MTNSEFSEQFNVLYNNIVSNQAPGLDEYEKSVFLTKAQLDLIRDYFSNRLDAQGGFDGSQKRQYDFSSIINTKFLAKSDLDFKLDYRSIVYSFPNDYFLTVNEVIEEPDIQDQSHKHRIQYSVTPLNYEEYQRLMLQPYNYPLKRESWRLFSGTVDKYGNLEPTEVHVDKYVRELYPEYNFTTNHLEPYISKLCIGITCGTAHIDSDTWNWQLCSKEVTIGDNTFRINLSPQYTILTNNSDSRATYIDLEIGHDRTSEIRSIYNSLTDADIATIIKDVYDNIPQNLLNDTDHAYWRETKYRMNGFEDFHTGTERFFFSRDSDVNPSYCVMKCMDTSKLKAEVIGNFISDNLVYKLRYVRKPKPIILDDLSNYGTNLTIDGVSVATQCELPPMCHQEILERAVTLAKISWQGSTGTIVDAQRQQQNN